MCTHIYIYTYLNLITSWLCENERFIIIGSKWMENSLECISHPHSHPHSHALICQFGNLLRLSFTLGWSPSGEQDMSKKKNHLLEMCKQSMCERECVLEKFQKCALGVNQSETHTYTLYSNKDKWINQALISKFSLSIIIIIARSSIGLASFISIKSLLITLPHIRVIRFCFNTNENSENSVFLKIGSF